MSAGFPYLQKLRKSDLAEFAELSKLPQYAALKKAELEVALDEHLKSNSTTYGKDPALSEYYRRLSSDRKSPVKKLVEKVSEIVKSDDEVSPPATVKKTKKKTASPPEESSSEGPASSALVKTPAVKEIVRRSSMLASQLPIPPSPAVVTDAIEHQTKRLRGSISHAYDRTQIHEYADEARDFLSSPLIVNMLAIIVEAWGLRAEILPNKRLTEIPPVTYFKTTRTAVNVPDLFLLLDKSFWAPFSLWMLSTIILPATIAYFVNFPLKAHPSHSYATRRAAIQASSQMQFDPFVFNLAKGLICFLVFSQHFTFGGLFQHFTIATVNESIYGGYLGMLTTSSLGAIVALYEAVLKK